MLHVMYIKMTNKNIKIYREKNEKYGCLPKKKTFFRV